MSRNSRSGDRMTSLRPRPVTATVTKPSWMRPEAIVGPRSSSVESRGSTASLTSVLDHDSYESASDEEDEFRYEQSPKKHSSSRDNKENSPDSHQNNAHNDTYIKQKNPVKKKILRKFVESSQSYCTETDSPEPTLSPWEQWLIQKVKNNREQKREERQKRQEERRKKEEAERKKQENLAKSAGIFKEWVEKKNFEENLKKIKDKQEKRTEKIKKNEEKNDNFKVERKYREWLEKKREEELEKKREEKQKQAEKEREKEEKKAKAQAVFEKWCKQADRRPRSLPNSFGYTSGKLTGYHDTSAYPVPTFYNPMPWQPIHVPQPESKKKSKKPKPKKYVWNPEKYR